MRAYLALLTAAFLLSACGSSTGDRAASGAGIGAAAGTVVGAVTGLSLVQGALIGAAAGGLTGGLTDEDTINFGDPLWGKSDSSSSSSNASSGQTATNQASLNLTRDVQSGLRQLGYDPGPIDGNYGPKTKAAIERYQADNGLLTDGIVSAELSAHIRERVTQYQG